MLFSCLGTVLPPNVLITVDTSALRSHSENSGNGVRIFMALLSCTSIVLGHLSFCRSGAAINLPYEDNDFTSLGFRGPFLQRRLHCRLQEEELRI